MSDEVELQGFNRLVKIQTRQAGTNLGIQGESGTLSGVGTPTSPLLATFETAGAEVRQTVVRGGSIEPEMCFTRGTDHGIDLSTANTSIERLLGSIRMCCDAAIRH